ncbi:MAG: hypothetical protein AAFQ63_10835 [Cyanobacteria bacterium J06621_11]
MYKLVSLLCLAMVVATVIAFSSSSRSFSETTVSEVSLESVSSDDGLNEGALVASIDSDVIESDSIALPPVSQTFTAGDYQLVVEAQTLRQDPQQPDRLSTEWQTEAAIAILARNDTLQWEKALPHAYGPRFVVLTTNGQTLLLDEFINVASPYAITLLDAMGNQVAQYSFDEVKSAIALPAATLTQQATSGWWISAPPELSVNEDTVLIQTGGQVLMVDLMTGELTAGDSTIGDLTIGN